MQREMIAKMDWRGDKHFLIEIEAKKIEIDWKKNSESHKKIKEIKRR